MVSANVFFLADNRGCHPLLQIYHLAQEYYASSIRGCTSLLRMINQGN